MARTPRREMIKEFIEEVKSYIPLLLEGLNSLKTEPGRNDIIEEVHRLSHTIKGASSLVGLHGLSKISFQMEEELENILSGNFPITQNSIQTMQIVVDLIKEYCRDFFTKKARSREILRKTVLSFRRLHELPTDEDKKIINELLDSIPEYESLPDETKTDEKTESLPSYTEPSYIDHEDSDIETEMDAQEGQKQYEAKTPEPLPELLESFNEEAEEHLEEFSTALNNLDSQITSPARITPSRREEIRQIRRSVHTLKGAAAVIGLQDFSGFAHSLEDLLDWLFEQAREITPDIISVLIESADILERIVETPMEASSKKADFLKKKYFEIMDSESTREMDKQPSIQEDNGIDENEIIEPDESEYTENNLPDTAILPAKTLRVNIERIDEMVNLAGELIIASSAFDQKMLIFQESVNELELARKRLREIAREMEISYEVKALEGIEAALESRGSINEGVSIDNSFDDFDSLELDRYSQLNLIIRTLNESSIDVGTINTQLSTLHSEFDGHLTRQRVILSELQDKMMRVRMTPMAVITNRLRRTVREVASKLNKKVQLVIEGADIELDKMIWDKMTDPLMHLLRNAVDHGIESRKKRKGLKKPENATIRLTAAREGNQVAIRIIDDGKGLDYEAIRHTAQKANLASNVSDLSNDELSAFIFNPGFSTRKKISEVSGRGVGLDIVKENIRDLKGAVSITSEGGKGARFTIRIPLTLATIRALLFKADGRMFAIALNEITEIVRVENDNMIQYHDHTMHRGDEVLPLFNMSNMLNPNQEAEGKKQSSKYPVLLIIETGGKRGAVIIDSLVGQREIVIKSLGTLLHKVNGISGATIMGDGSVVPILNIEEYFWPGKKATPKTIPPGKAVSDQPLDIMIVDDSVSIRQVVSRLVKDQGWTAQTAKDGVDAIEKLGNKVPDLIILDIEMPRMNGYEFLGTFRTLPGCRRTPVIILSSRTARKHRDKAISLGAQGYIVKPYNSDEFVSQIIELTEKNNFSEVI